MLLRILDRLEEILIGSLMAAYVINAPIVVVLVGLLMLAGAVVIAVALALLMRHAVRAPEGELGLRGGWERVNFDLSVYTMEIKDDILVMLVDEATVEA